MEAGALGFSTSRTLGPPRHGRRAGAGNVRRRGRAVRARSGHGSAAGRRCSSSRRMGASGEDLLAPKQEMGWMAEPAAETRSAGVVHDAPDRRRPRPVAQAHGRARCRDAAPATQVYPQVAARPFGMLLGFPSRHGFTSRPTYRAAERRACWRDELLAELAKPAVRAQILAEADVARRPDRAVRRLVPVGAGRRSTGSTRSATRRSTSPRADSTIAAIAAAAASTRWRCSTT